VPPTTRRATVEVFDHTSTRESRVRDTLRLAVYRQPVRLGAKPLETHGQNYFSQVNSCGTSPYVTSSLTRGRFCRFQLLLAIASAFTIGSESRWTRDHNSLLVFSFCRLLRTRRSTVEVFDPNSTTGVLQTLLLYCFGEPCRSHLFQQWSY
jgi:hypothetical protein